MPNALFVFVQVHVQFDNSESAATALDFDTVHLYPGCNILHVRFGSPFEVEGPDSPLQMVSAE